MDDGSSSKVKSEATEHKVLESANADILADRRGKTTMRLSGLPFVRVDEPLSGGQWSCNACGYRDNSHRDTRCGGCQRVNFQVYSRINPVGTRVGFLAEMLGDRKIEGMRLEELEFRRVDEAGDGPTWSCLCGLTNSYCVERCKGCRRVNFQAYYEKNRPSLSIPDLNFVKSACETPSEENKLEEAPSPHAILKGSSADQEIKFLSDNQWLTISNSSTHRDIQDEQIPLVASQLLCELKVTDLELRRPCEGLDMKEWVCQVCTQAGNPSSSFRCASCHRVDFQEYTATRPLSARNKAVIQAISSLLDLEKQPISPDHTESPSPKPKLHPIVPEEPIPNVEEEKTSSSKPSVDCQSASIPQKNAALWMIVPVILLCILLWVWFQTAPKRNSGDR